MSQEQLNSVIQESYFPTALLPYSINLAENKTTAFSSDAEKDY